MIFNPVIKKTVSFIGTASPKDVNFYDYNGTLIDSYTVFDAQALTTLPGGPTHNGLIFQGWNWSLEKIKTLNRPMNVGAQYVTDDGKTRLKIHVWEKARSNVPLYINQSVANGVTIDWGDGSIVETLASTGNVNTSHQYANVGSYTITLSVADGCTLGLGWGSSSYCVMGPNVEDGLVYCNLLQEVQIGYGVTSIGASAFQSCFSLSAITIPDSVKSIGNNAFKSCYSLSAVAIPDFMTSIGSSMFQHCYTLHAVMIPNSVTSIGGNAFLDCYSLMIITIPDSIKSIGNNAFRSCYSMPTIVIPNSVTSIGTSTFQSCFSLSAVTIPDSIKSIGASMFQYCSSLSAIAIPDSVTSIGNNAFLNCYGVGEYHMKSPTPPSLSGVNAFENIPTDCVIYVPIGSLETYKAATNWSTYAGHMQEEPA